MTAKTDEQSTNEATIPSYEETVAKEKESHCAECDKLRLELIQMLRENQVLAALLKVTCIPFDDKHPDLINELKALCAGKQE